MLIKTKRTPYPLATKEIVEAQQQDNDLKTKAEKEGYSIQLVKNINILSKDGKTVIPKSLQHRAVLGFTTTCITLGPTISKKLFDF